MNQQILDLFVNKEYTVQKISKYLKIDIEIVRNTLLLNYYPTLYRTRKETLRMHDAMLCYINSDRSLLNIAKEYNMGDDNLAKNLRLCGVTIEDRQHKPKFNENIFDIIDTEEKAYWLGFIFADGYIETPKPNMKYTFEICLSCKDKHHLEKFNIFMQHKNMNIKVYTHLDKIANKERTNARWIVANKHLWNTLNNLGCTPQKSLTLKFPNIKEELKRHFIRGYIDGDGTIGYYGKYNTVHCECIGTYDILYNMFTSLNFIPRIFNKPKRYKKETMFFTMSGSKAKEFINYIYKDCNIYLDRKYQKYIEICRL